MATSPDPALEALLAYIKDERGFDFTGYKRASLERRVRRRMDQVSVHTFEDYHDFLLLHPDEFTALFNTILINLTSFFRDQDAWAYLSDTLVPELLQNRAGHSVRAWSAGCATGEEAYTLAMVLAEAVGIDALRERVKIYATDVDEEALTQARQATYSSRELSHVPEPMREKYFHPVGERFVLRQELRRSVIFGRNDLVQDAPISHIDILTCRNTLMYFNAETQAQVLNRLHFALRPDGILFLGKAEMLLSHSPYFRPVELKRRFFTKVPIEPLERRPFVATKGDNRQEAEASDAARLRDAALMQSPAAQIALDQAGRLAACNNRAIQLFGLTRHDLGRRIQDLELSYRPVELRAPIEEAVSQRRPVLVRDVTLPRGSGELMTLDVQVIPVADGTGIPLGVTVIFNDVTQHRQLENDLQYANRQLETAYEELQSTNEKLETTNEELQSAVEGLETANEELQSTNEELETMNEELQSMNDALQLSNEALHDRQDELDRLNHFMSAVLGSMNSGVAVVDADMRVLAWNTRSEDLWGVRADEAVGDLLFNLDVGIPLDQVRQALRGQVSDPSEPIVTTLQAVNRRGRSVDVRVTVTHLTDERTGTPAAMLVMEVVNPV